MAQSAWVYRQNPRLAGGRYRGVMSSDPRISLSRTQCSRYEFTLATQKQYFPQVSIEAVLQPEEKDSNLGATCSGEVAHSCWWHQDALSAPKTVCFLLIRQTQERCWSHQRAAFSPQRFENYHHKAAKPWDAWGHLQRRYREESVKGRPPWPFHMTVCRQTHLTHYSEKYMWYLCVLMLPRPGEQSLPSRFILSCLLIW